MDMEKFDKNLLEVILNFKAEGKLKLIEIKDNNGKTILLCPELIIAIYGSANGGTTVEYITGQQYWISSSTENVKKNLGI
jgi:hypothetical protein